MEAKRTEDEEKLVGRIQAATGGRVVSLERQPRHRPAWFARVERDAELLGVYVRGDRASDVQPFRELGREADILQLLERHGIAVPHVYGMCDDPPAILMEQVPGTRDVAEAPSDDARRSVARQYVETLVAMHGIPLEPFVEIGLRRPVGAQQIALAGLDAYMPLYRRRKARPEPLLEFAIGWLRRHTPMGRDRASFVAFDAGQFLFEGDRMTSIYDLEYALIGDPMADLATMALREPIEPMGDEIRGLCQLYADLAGECLDVAAIRFHQVVFSTVATMQFAGAVAAPAAGDPHDVYLGWWLYLRRCLILTLCESMGIEPPSVEAPVASPAAAAPLIAMLEDRVRAQPAEGEEQRAARRSSLALVTYLAEVARHGPEVDRIACEEARPLIGEVLASRAELDARLERFVSSAAPDDDERLLRFFARDVERQRIAYRAAPLGRSADFARLVEL
jgi:aminoglycoside phosphotransferase (APT) family kinase protein